MKKFLLSSVFCLIMSGNVFAFTGFDPVDFPFDIQNLVTSLKNTINSTMQLYNQYQELANSVKQVKSWETNLKKLSTSVGTKNLSLNSNQMSLFRNNYMNVKGIGYKNIQSSFDGLYRINNLPTGTSWGDQFQKWNDEIINGCNDAMNMIGVVGDLEDTLKSIFESQSQSMSAGGAVEVGQAGNQINAVTAQENVKQTALLSELVKMESQKQANEAAQEKARQQMNKDFATGMSKQTKVKSIGLDVVGSEE